MARLHRWLLVAFLCCMVLAACGSGSAPTTAPAAAHPPLKFGYDLWPGYYPAVLAREKGFFEKAGVKVEVIKPEKTDTMMADFTAGKYDAIAVALGDLVSLTQSNPDLKIILVSDESAGGDAVVANPDIKTPADLRGKRLGVNLGGFGELFVTTMLADHGLAPTDVTLIDIDAAELAARLNSGDIQAGHSWEPYVTEASTDGRQVIFSSAETPGLIPDAIAFRGAVVRERPADVRAFVTGWFEAVDYWQANSAEGTNTIATALNIPADTISLKGIKLMTRADNQKLFEVGQTTASLHHTTGLYLDFYARIGTIRTRPDIAQLLDGSFVKSQ